MLILHHLWRRRREISTSRTFLLDTQVWQSHIFFLPTVQLVHCTYPLLKNCTYQLHWPTALTNSAVGLWYNIYCTDGEQWKWTVSMRLTFFRQNNAILSPSLEAWRKRRRRRRRRQVPPTSSSTNLLLESVISWTLRKHIAHNCARQVFSHYKHMSGQEEGTTELGWAFEEDKKIT